MLPTAMPDQLLPLGARPVDALHCRADKTLNGSIRNAKGDDHCCSLTTLIGNAAIFLRHCMAWGEIKVLLSVAEVGWQPAQKPAEIGSCASVVE